MNDTITIPRKLAFRLLGEMEHMAYLIDSELGDTRTLRQIIADGAMHDSYYKLRAAMEHSNGNNDLIDIERDNK